MIIEIILNNTATYTQKVEIKPTEINYYYGANGSGKTTLSKVIADEPAFSDCSLSWQASPMETLVYNKDFVKSHFSQSSPIKGIFTLGKDAVEAEKFIEKNKKGIEEHVSRLLGLNTTIKNKCKEIDKLTDEMINKCWSVKDKHLDAFREAYTGVIGSKKIFFNKCKQELNNNSLLLSLDDIKAKCTRVFSKSLQAFDQIPMLVIPNIKSLESHPILTTKIVGKEDAPISALISKLENSDWIKEGVGYLLQTETQCPFCQQAVSSMLKSGIESVFNETYNQQIEELKAYETNYKTSISTLIQTLKQITERDIAILNFTELKVHIRLLEEEFGNNLTTIQQKIKSPSLDVNLKPISMDLDKANTFVDSFRKIIETNNSTARNIRAEEIKLKSEIWKFIADELSEDFEVYQTKLTGFQSANIAIESQITQRTNDKINLQKKIKEKEADVTSIIHTKNEINKILKSFGFSNFSISEAENGHYKVIRENGEDAKETLSEGEYTFITFLYFYQLLKGSTKESGLTNDKVIVIDDPISSLDSNVLFIVSNLIKEIVANCRNKKDGIKQVFILTHNIYFHKEVTFKGSRNGQWKEESYWIVRNTNNRSEVIRHDENPIQTTYELLWREIKKHENINKATIFNTLRRILEYYFNIIGGIDYEKCIDEFEGDEKIIFKSLFSWINDGSHFINDDLVVYAEPENIVKQLNVFKGIFIKLNHESHYNMMMGIEN